MVQQIRLRNIELRDVILLRITQKLYLHWQPAAERIFTERLVLDSLPRPVR